MKLDFSTLLAALENNGKRAAYNEADPVVCSVLVCLHAALHLCLPTLRLGQSH
jgi:hypothetical protein